MAVPALKNNRLIPLQTWLSGWSGLLLPLLIVVLWQYTSSRSATHAYAFVPLQDVGRTFLELVYSGELWINFCGSLERTALGLSLGVVAGVSLGLLMYYARLVALLVNPLYNALRQVPLLGLTPLIGLWFGNGDEAKVFIIALAAFYPMVLNSYEGLRNVDGRFREVGQIYGFSRWQQFRLVLWPAALPNLVTGLLLAIPFAWITCIGSELLFNAGAGLGNLMMTAEASARMDIILICALVVTLLGVVMNYAVSVLGNYLLRWRGKP
ncbi:AtsB [Cellvibrio japonicus Ueda107]|uniref:AtsB n=1 Tax=Cellvibrio japonicus (strain Ueda107) TaxID=498211 RepID=B3PJW0_CELJU|nr:AtsB [Cellvibrio japonicus Ueda107]